MSHACTHFSRTIAHAFSCSEGKHACINAGVIRSRAARAFYFYVCYVVKDHRLQRGGNIRETRRRKGQKRKNNGEVAGQRPCRRIFGKRVSLGGGWHVYLNSRRPMEIAETQPPHARRTARSVLINTTTTDGIRFDV